MSTTPTPDEPKAEPPDPDEIYSQVHTLFAELLNEADYILKAGTTQNKIALMRSVIPALMKELSAREDSKAKNVQYEALDKLFQTARGQIKPHGPDTVR